MSTTDGAAVIRRPGRRSDGPGPPAGAVDLSRARRERPRRALALATATAFLALAIGGSAAPAAGEEWIGVPLSGAPMVNVLVGNYLVGRSGGEAAFALRFAPDGTVVFANDRGGTVRGSWQIVDTRVCIQWTDAPLPACQQPWLDGDRLTFTDGAGQPVASTQLSHQPPGWAADLLE